MPEAEGTSDRAPVALLLAVLLSCGLPAAAAARDQWNGEGNGYGYDGDRHREERREMRREQEAEEVQRERWQSFYHARMHEHFEREGYAWARLPDWQKERVIKEDWERWGERRWERPG